MLFLCFINVFYIYVVCYGSNLLFFLCQLSLIIAGNDLMNEKKFMDSRKNRNEYMATYEDKDGDWMLLGDAPWK